MKWFQVTVNKYFSFAGFSFNFQRQIMSVIEHAAAKWIKNKNIFDLYSSRNECRNILIKIVLKVLLWKLKASIIAEKDKNFSCKGFLVYRLKGNVLIKKKVSLHLASLSVTCEHSLNFI